MKVHCEDKKWNKEDTPWEIRWPCVGKITKDCERDHPNIVKERSRDEPSGLRVWWTDRGLGRSDKDRELDWRLAFNIYIVLWFGLLMSLSSSVNTLPLLLLSSYRLIAMSDIYTHEDILDFTNPFLDFEQGYQAPWKFAAILVSPKTVLPAEPLTCMGYPRGESQGDSSGMSSFTPFWWVVLIGL